jgi:DNA-binding NarL/FixJ family response regulator
LLERIAAATYQAWSERRPGESLAQLQPRIASLLEDGDASAEPQERLSPESLGKMQQEIAQWSNIASSLEEWTAIQEASQRLDELAARAGLSLREAEVLALMRQGLTQEQIGARLTPPLPRDTVKTYAERIATKMYDAAMK